MWLIVRLVGGRLNGFVDSGSLMSDTESRRSGDRRLNCRNGITRTAWHPSGKEK